MSDLRDQTYAPDNGAMRFADAPIILDEPIREDVVFVDDGGLRDLHISHEAEDDQARRKTLFGGLAVALLVGVAGAWGVSMYMKDQPVVADSSLPSPSAPTNTAAMTPPPKPAALETAPSATMPAPDAIAPAAPDVVKPAPVTKQASVTNAPKVMAAPQTTLPPPSEQYTAPAVTAPAPVQSQAANVPEPVSPTPPASALAGNPPLNEQSAQSPDEALTPPAAAQPEAAAPQAAPAEPASAQ